MENTEIVTQETQAAALETMPDMATAEDLELAIKKATRTIELVKQIKELTFKLTNSHDWVDMQGKPYLQASGAEKVARPFGVSWKLEQPKKETISDENGSYYMYSCKGKFTLGGKTIEVFGTCSQKDKFFGRDKNGKNGLKAASEIDETNIIKKATTNAIAKGVSTILGIRNLTWAELEKGGIKREGSAKVTYAQGGAGGGKISDAQAKRLFAIMKSSGVAEKDLQEYLKKTYKVEHSKDINRSDYEAICAWVQNQETQTDDTPEM